MSKIIPVMRIFDRSKTIEFYVDWLGFKINWEYAPENSPTYLQVSLRDITIDLSEHHGCTPGAEVSIEDFEGLEVYQAELMAKNYKYGKPGLRHPEWPPETLALTVIDPFSNRIIFSEKVKR
jgi:hypothetical protein